jgi:putative membrane protein insertion efficiency factor
MSVLDWPRQTLIGLVQGYRLLLKPWLGNACRFEPTCSQYALDALRRHGALAGATLTTGRLLRCHPWCAGGLDPVPARPPGLFTRLGLGGDAAGDPMPETPASNRNPS